MTLCALRFGRIAGASLLGLGLLGVACGAATPGPPTTPIGSTPPGELRAEQNAVDASGPPADASAMQAPEGDAGEVSDGGCAYGKLEDPHRGFVRCLAQNEADAGWLPPVSQAEPIDAGTAPSPPPIVDVGEPAFQNGDVPKAPKFLTRAADDIGKCIAAHGGLSGNAGKMKLQFLVRARGRAEGVEIVSSKGVSEDAKECVRLLVKNRMVGVPSSDPVGVTVTIALKAK